MPPAAPSLIAPLEQTEKARKAEEEARKAKEEKARKAEEEARKAEEKTRQAEAEKTSRQPKEPSTPRFNLQLKAFRHRAEAVEFVAEISPQLGERAELIYIKSATSKGKPIYRVRMGPFGERSAAQEAQRDYIKRFGKRDAPFISLR
jgi:cell division septation protein DedD